MSTQDKKISKELSIDELQRFVSKWVKKPVSKDKLADEYPNIFEAIEKGLFILDDNCVPKYVLVTQINPDGDFPVKEINFKTRVKPSTKADLADGLNLQTQVAKYSLRLIAFITGQELAMLDNFDSFDYDVISETASVFMSGGR